MKKNSYPVDVISVCNADGEIRPLRLRMNRTDEEPVIIHISDVLKVTEIVFVGVESRVFLCRANQQGREILFELKYTFSSHSWCLLRRIC